MTSGDERAKDASEMHGSPENAPKGPRNQVYQVSPSQTAGQSELEPARLAPYVFGPDAGEIPPNIALAPGFEIDAGVILGYRTGRPIPEPLLVIGPDATLRSGTVVYCGSVIGERFETGHNVVIREENEIGDRVQVWSNSTIDYGCKIGSRVKIHVGCYVAQFSVLEDDVFLAPGVVLANDMYPGQQPDPELVGPTLRRGAQIGVNSSLRPGVEVGEFALVGTASVVVDDVPPGTVVVGNPARVIKRVEELGRG